MADSSGHQAANIPLLATKLFSPPWQPGLVARPRLVARLREGAGRKLTLVSAPAGFGKTTLLAEWLATDPAPVAAWVSLDAGDNDPALFWAYCIAALQKTHPGVGGRALALLHAPQPQPVEAVLTTLINEFSAVDGDCALVLDDFHLIDAQPIHGALAFLLDHLPPRMHLVVASRADPPLPLARMRARGEATELRAADLRFAPDEAAAFLNAVMGLELAADDIAALETRTEGWIAGLQLAALSMQGRRDTAGFVAAFSGDDRYVVDYLVEEVLQRQPDDLRDFLLQTAILDKLSGPLCDAVTARDGGQARLAALERGNLFVVPLDDKRRWYRYHHLFADVLQAHALAERPERIPALHRRASAWYEANGLPADAIRHALAAQDLHRAADLVEITWPTMRMHRRESSVRNWIAALPDALVRARPVLCAAHALTLMDAGDFAAAEDRLRDAEHWLGATTATSGMAIADEAQWRSLPASIANARAYRAQALGDVPGTVAHAGRALELLPPDDHYERGTTAALLGLAHWTSGDLEAAYQYFAEGMAHIEKTGGHLIAIGGTLILATIRIAQGRLRDALYDYERSLRLSERHGPPPPQGTAELYMGLSQLHLERGDLAAARQCLQRGEALRPQAGQPGFAFLWSLARANIKQADGDLGGALDLLDLAERQFNQTPIPDIRPIAAQRARLWLAQGQRTAAQAWARAQGLTTDDQLSYLREFEHITLARMLIAQDQYHQALALLERLLQAAQTGGRDGSALEILVLQAIARKAQGDPDAAFTSLLQALALAAPEGHVRLFADAAEPLRDLLIRAAADADVGPYARHLLAAGGEDAPPVAPTGLVVPLTARETEILHLIAAGLRNRAIADQLFISPATVKRHISNLYRKLAVTHRTAALSRARELNLL